MIKTIYRGRDNEESISVRQNGVLVNFSPVTRMTLLAGGILFDSAIDSTLINWSGNDGKKITFKIGASTIPLGLHGAVLVAYDPLHPNGQVIAHPAGPKLTFRVVR